MSTIVKTKVKSPGVVVAQLFMIVAAATIVALPGLFVVASYKYSAISNTNNSNTNTNTRVIQVCGNGRLELGELCDDGNQVNCDGCRKDCRSETSEELVACGYKFSGVAFKRGDANLDNIVNMSDAIYIAENAKLLERVSRKDAVGKAYAEIFGCLDAIDADGDHAIDPLKDSKAITDFLFLAGKALPAPGAQMAGIDTTHGALGCRCTDNSCTKDAQGIVTRAAIHKIGSGGGGSIGDIPECNDGWDNDNDGNCDYAGCAVDSVQYPADPDCAGNTWTTEEPFLYYKRSMGGIDGTMGVDNIYMTSVGDIDNNGKSELITIGRAESPWFTQTGCLKAIDVNGRDLYDSLGEARQCGFNAIMPMNENVKPPTLVDLDGIGGKEIIVVDADGGMAPSSIVLIDAPSGNLKCRYSPSPMSEPPMPPTEILPIYDYTIADMNADGKQEIVILTSRKHEDPTMPGMMWDYLNIDVVEPISCTQIASYASRFIGMGMPLGGSIGPRLFPAKLDSDNRIDIIVSGVGMGTLPLVKYSMPVGITPVNSLREQILVLGKDPMDPTGNSLAQFPWNFESTHVVAVADLNKDGKHEFIVHSGGFNSNNGIWVMQYTNSIVTITDPSFPQNPINGTPLYVMRTLWKGDSERYPLVVADLENDGNFEVLALGGMVQEPNSIAVYRGNNPTANGNRVEPLRYIRMNEGPVDPMQPFFNMRNFVAADMDGDGIREIVASGSNSDGGNAIKIFNSMGVKMAYMSFWSAGGENMHFVISDLDGNGSQEIITGNSWETMILEVNTQFFQTQPKDPYPWKELFHDIQSWNTANSCAVNSDCAAPLACGSYSCVNYQCVRNYASCSRGAQFIRGDVDKDGMQTINDIVWLVGFIFNNDPSLKCPDAVDVDDNGRMEFSDIMMLLGYNFLNDPIALPQPNDALGYDPSPDMLPLCQ